MDKYLKQLLETYAKVILPSFGAIVVENEETGNLMFNEYLSYNDGKLDDLIVSESNMELQEAQNMIAKYVRDIQVQIDKGESYDIFELGRFYKNKDGEIEFEGNLKSGPKSQSKKDTPKAATTKDSESTKKKEEKAKKEDSKPKEDKKEAKPEPKKEESKKETKVDSKDNKEVKKDTKAETKSTEKENKFVAKKEADAKKEKSKQEVKKEAKPVKKEKAPKPPKKKKEKTPKDGKKKKRFGAFFWIAIIILGLASAGLIYVGLNYEEVKSYMGWDKFDNKENVDSNESKEKPDNTEAEQQEPVEFDADGNTVSDSTETSNDENSNEVEEEEVNNSEAESTPSPEPTPVTTSSTGSHHLIAGSFSNLSNAKSLVDELKSKGLDAKILGEFGGLHFVSAASYNSSKEARADINRIRQNAPGSWIFKYNNK